MQKYWTVFFCIFFLTSKLLKYPLVFPSIRSSPNEFFDMVSCKIIEFIQNFLKWRNFIFFLLFMLRNYLLAFPSATDLLRLFLLILPWFMVLLLDDGDIVAITAFGCCGESKAADVPVNWVTLIVFPCWACCGFEAVGEKK